MIPVSQFTAHEEECRLILGTGASRRYGHVCIRLVSDPGASVILPRFVLSSDRLRESDVAEVQRGITDWLSVHGPRLANHQLSIEVFDGTWAGDSGSAHYEAVQRALDSASAKIGLLKYEDTRA